MLHSLIADPIKRTLFATFASLLFLSCILTTGYAFDQNLYLAAGGQIEVYRIDSATGKLHELQNVDLEGAGPFTFSHDGTRLYAMATKDKSPQMATLERRADGTLAILNVAPINMRAGYLDVERSGKFIAGNNYKTGKVSVWKLDDAVYRGETVMELMLEPKAHGANFSSDNRWLLVPATGPNKVFVNRFDTKTGRLSPNNPPFAIGPIAVDQARHPRHLLFHPTNHEILYTTNESSEPGVCVWNWNNAKGTLKPIQNIVTKPDDFEGRMSTATLHLTPDARYLYVSNRNKDGHSSIVGFRVNSEDGRLTMIDQTPCENVPRSFCMDRTGKFIYVAGQIDNRLGVYSIDQATGKLTKVEQHQVGKRPSWVEAR